MRQRIFIALTALLLSFATHAHAIRETTLTKPVFLNFSLGTGIKFETGDYDTEQEVDTWQIPLFIEWSPVQRLALSLEIPFVYQNISTEPGMIGPGSTEDVSESGLDDIIFNATGTLLNEKRRTPRLLALLYTKFPTADEQKGLGTGEFDWGGGIGIGKKFGDWSTYAEALYILPGDPEFYPLDNYWEWLASASFRASASLRPGISLSGGTAAIAGRDKPLEIKAKLSGLSGELTSYSIYISRGLSESSPDWGIGIFGYLDF